MRSRFGSRLALLAALLILCSTQRSSDRLFEVSKNLDIFNSVYQLVNLLYVDDTEPGELMKVGIDAMLESLDPYTVYIPESDIETYRFKFAGQFGGIGAKYFALDGAFVISEIFEDFPAHEAGLKVGDRIVKVNGKAVDEIRYERIEEVFQGAAGAALNLTVKGVGENTTKEVAVTRAEIQKPDIPYYGMLDDETGYISLSSFTRTASASVIEAYEELKAKHDIKKLVFDLRDNGGGLLIEAVKIVNMFVPANKLVVTTKGKMEKNNQIYKTQVAPVAEDIPLVLLVDSMSASASEIVSGTLQDYDRAVLVGNRTYGKGLVQQPHDADYGSKVKITIAKYYIPSGRCIQKVDYSKKDKQGKAQLVDEASIQAFKTENGRKVYDGRGVDPEIVVKRKEGSDLSQALIRTNLMFDFVNTYTNQLDSIASPEGYEFTDEDYAAFKKFVLEKGVDYETDTEKLLDQLKKMAQKEDYFSAADAEFEQLTTKLKVNLESDLDKFKPELQQLLKYEVVSRFHFAEGKIKVMLSEDPVVLKALEIIHDQQAYENLLKTVQ